MSTVAPEVEELRICLDRVRALLDALIVRGLRACGEHELNQLKSFAEDLEKSGAGHVAGSLSDLHEKITADDRTAARTLLLAQTSVRLLERLLTLRVAKDQFQAALSEEENRGE